MEVLERKNKVFLVISLVLVITGFLCMKFEKGHYGLGLYALSIAPLLVVSGYLVGILSIFPEIIRPAYWKAQIPVLVGGWAVFFMSLIIYVLTLEETASLWDCAEFVACAYKLQVPHSPGAPLFLMVGRLFSFLAFGNRTEVAFWINMSSALYSALTVMFTFWTVVMLGKRIWPTASNFSLILSGSVGAFTIAHADSFWFSAVEAETYAMASLFIVTSFWAILKWDRQADDIPNGKWIVFIFYLLGLSVGAHPMSLLVLPALALIIFFKNKPFSWKLLMYGTILGALCILFLNHVILFGLPDAMKYLDIFFVNVLGFPFYTGATVFGVLLMAIGFYGYRWSVKRRRKMVSLGLIGMMYFLIGYSSYFMIIIRSQSDPSIDEHNPENLVSLASYLKRESYGSRPFLYGPHFTSKVISYDKGGPVYRKGEQKYEISDHKIDYKYDDQTLFPRMYSNQENHINSYRQWSGLKEDQKPDMIDNLRFMVQYQFGHMYLRYLMFNFSGRASDIQHADWLGPWHMFEKLPESLKRNRARNNFLMLPLLLGFMGMFLQLKQDKKGFWAVMALFLFLGLILVFYLNSPPNEPRERDYIYVGSYLAFAFWCGVGTLGILRFLDEKLKVKFEWLGCLLICIPLWMLIEGYDDHDRSGRTLHIDHARNTLASCAPNAVLFTGGDNDTFPLWYVQEVEGFRTDVRVIVLSYFNGDWYIDQMQRIVYQSDPLPFSLENRHYRQGGLNDILPYVENVKVKGAINLNRFLELIRSEHKALQVAMSTGTMYNSIPSRTFYLDVDKENIKRKGIVPEPYHGNIQEKMELSWNGRFLEKSALMVLDLIANGNWDRPIYFNLTSLNSIALNLKSHVMQEGLVYRLLPIYVEQQGAIDASKMYENLIRKAVYRDIENENIYYNHEDFHLRIIQTTRANYNALANHLMINKEFEKAREVVNFIQAKLYGRNTNLDITTLATTELLFRLGIPEQAMLLAERLYSNADEILDYLSKRDGLDSSEGQTQLYVLRQLHRMCLENQKADLAEKCSFKFNAYYSLI